MSLFDKPLEKVTIDDVRWLITAQVQEGQQIEFKRALADENGLDGWHAGKNNVGRYAIAGLVKEIVAFANAQGGTLVLGLDETDEAPPRAKEILPLPRAFELAERLRQRLRDNIEPALYGLDVVAVPTDGDEGVIVARVAASPFSPHRSMPAKECYYRRNASSTPMTMDEIQRHVLGMARRLETVEKRFQSFRIADDEKLSRNLSPSWAIRMAALPLGPMYVPNIQRNELAKPKITDIVVKSGPQDFKAPCLVMDENWRPIIRGRECIKSMRNGGFSCLRVGADGHMYLNWEKQNVPDDRQQMFLGWFTASFANMLIGIERLRLAAATPEMEYAVEVQLGIFGSSFSLTPYYHTCSESFGSFRQGLTVIGRYPVTSRASFNEITRAFEADICHHAAQDNIGENEFAYAPLLAKIDAEFGSAQSR